MLQSIGKLLLAALIAAGIVGYVTGWEFGQVGEAADRAYGDAVTRKAERIAAAEAPPQPPAAEDVVDVVVLDTVATSLPEILRMTGATEASRRVEVRAETSGAVEITTTKGARVQQGELLCRLAVGDRRARREALVARYRQAQTDSDAQARLSERGFAAANRASEFRTNADVIRAEVAQLDVEIGRLEIRAPFAGLVEEEPAQLGSFLQPGSVCATLVDPDPLRAVGFVPEFQVGKLSLGMPGEARLATGALMQGTVTFIAQTADPATRTFRVELSAPNPDYALKDQVTARIAIPLEARQAHEIPASALTLDDDGAVGVMVARDGAARFAAVEVLRDDGRSIFVAGLPDRERVIVVGQEYVRDGVAITTTSQTLDAVLGEPVAAAAAQEPVR